MGRTTAWEGVHACMQLSAPTDAAVLGLRQGIRHAEAQAAARNAEELADDKQPSRATKG